MVLAGKAKSNLQAGTNGKSVSNPLLDFEFASSLQYGNCICVIARIFSDSLFKLELKSDCLMFDQIDDEQWLLKHPSNQGFEHSFSMIKTKPLEVIFVSTGEWEINGESPAACSVSSGFSLKRYGLVPAEFFVCKILIQVDYYEVYFNDFRLNISEHLVPLGFVHRLLISGEAEVDGLFFGSRHSVENATEIFWSQILQKLDEHKDVTYIYECLLGNGISFEAQQYSFVNHTKNSNGCDPLKGFSVSLELTLSLEENTENLATAYPGSKKTQLKKNMAKEAVVTENIINQPFATTRNLHLKKLEIENQECFSFGWVDFYPEIYKIELTPNFHCLPSESINLKLSDYIIDRSYVEVIGKSTLLEFQPDLHYEHCQTLGSSLSIASEALSIAELTQDSLIFDDDNNLRDRKKVSCIIHPQNQIHLPINKSNLNLENIDYWNVEHHLAISWLDMNPGFEILLYLIWIESRAQSNLKYDIKRSLFKPIECPKSSRHSKESLVSISPLEDNISSSISSELSQIDSKQGSIPELNRIRKRASEWFKKKIRMAKNILNN